MTVRGRAVPATALLACCITSGGLAQSVVSVATLPDWKAPSDHDMPTLVVAEGTTVRWELSPRGRGAEDSSLLPEYQGALLPVVAGKPITVAAVVASGFPVIMITAGPIHPVSRMSQGGDTPLPGEPIAFTIAETNTAILSVNPAHDAVWQLWVWVLPDEFDPGGFVAASDEMDDEFFRPWLEAGLTREQVRTLLSPPQIIVAWER